jgi:hypothetical protein
MNYGKLLSNDYELYLLQMLNSIIWLCNHVLAFCDVESKCDYTISDHDLLCLSCFDPFFKDFRDAKVRDEIALKKRDLEMDRGESIIIHLSRVASLVFMINECKPELVKLENNSFYLNGTRTFNLDVNSRRKSALKMMKQLAVERLENQVSVLQDKLGVIDPNLPIFVPDIDVYVYNLVQIKQWLMTKKAIIIVTTTGIFQLTSFATIRRFKKGL